MRRVRLAIYGEVQGVGFRFQARRQAHALGLSGWVRNAGDGSVLALVEGSAHAVDEFIGWAHRGPPSAWVERVDIQDEQPTGEDVPFKIEG